MARTIATGPTPPRPNPLAGLFSGGEGALLMDFLGSRMQADKLDQENRSLASRFGSDDGSHLNSKVQGRSDSGVNPMAMAGFGSEGGSSLLGSLLS